VKVYGDISHIEWDDRDTLVLYRTHYLRRELEKSLINRGIPYTVEAGKLGVMSTRGYRAIEAWERFSESGKMGERDEALISEFACHIVSRAIKNEDYGKIRDLGWSRAMILPDNVTNFKNAMKSGEVNIRLSTIHGSKGREADRVVLLTAQTCRTMEGAVKDPVAEAMVWYVGVTRARESLDIIMGDLNYDIRA